MKRKKVILRTEITDREENLGKQTCVIDLGTCSVNNLLNRQL